MARKTANRPEYTMDEARLILRGLVRTKYDYQHMRIATCNRLEKKKDGTSQNKPESQLAQLDLSSVPDIVDTFLDAKMLEDALDKRIASHLNTFPIYTEFLKNVKGCGAAMSAVIISEFDIKKAETVSKMWQFAGTNPGSVYGKKKKDGEIITTEDFVRGDKPTTGFLIPYNKFLKSKLLGVLADCMVKSKSEYTKYYYNMKQRLTNSEKFYMGDESRPWNKESKLHINRAALRYMIKMFLLDLYKEWRALENLPVRCPYAEQYLGHTTSMSPVEEGRGKGESMDYGKSEEDMALEMAFEEAERGDMGGAL